MSRLIKDNGIIALAKMIVNLTEQVGGVATIEIVKGSPKTFIDLLANKNLVSEKLEDVGVPKGFISIWSKKNTGDNIEKLKLSEYQAVLLSAIIKNNNSATLDELKKEFKKRKINVGTGSMIGGSLAGITKKCTAYGIPKVFRTTKGKDNQDIYSLIPTEKDILSIIKERLDKII